MALDLLKRELAPILPPAFAAVDAEAARVLKLNLAGRRIVDFRGPHGWELAAVNTDGAGTKTLAWRQFTLDFVAAQASTTIAFLNGDPSNDNSNILDDVVLN